MDIEQIKQVATDINNVASASFQSGREHTERLLLARLEKLVEVCTKVHDALLALHVCDQDKEWAGNLRAELKQAIEGS